MPLVLIAVMLFVFWIIMLVDSIKRRYQRENDKIVWVLVIIFTGLIGALIYYFVVYFKDNNKSMKWFWFTLACLFVLFIIVAVIVIAALISIKSY